jgi:hypothetical protein
MERGAPKAMNMEEGENDEPLLTARINDLACLRSIFPEPAHNNSHAAHASRVSQLRRLIHNLRTAA